MPSLDSLPGDQRAVLQLVLGKGRGYGEIARLLSIDPAAVRARALAAAGSLAPPSAAPADRRELIVDFLLDQLDDTELARARDLLADSPGDRAWARALSASLAPLSDSPLPEIPTAQSSAPPAAQDAPTPAQEAPPVAAAAEPAAPIAPAQPAASVTPAEPAAPQEPAPDKRQRRRRRDRDRAKSGDGPRSSRIGGAILIGVAIAVIAIVLIKVLSSNSPAPARDSSGAASARSTTNSHSVSGSASSAAGTPATVPASTTSSATSATKVLASINLLPPPVAGHTKAAGIAEILREGSADGLAIVAQGVAPNSTKPPNAYAVWLYNSPTDAHNLGFVSPGVGKTGRFSTATTLPANAKRYHKLIVTLESTGRPKAPGQIILEGTLTGLS
ncbi:MAG: hypothetical protein ACRDMX_15460 [Solirubrobacteraceae bacterium]